MASPRGKTTKAVAIGALIAVGAALTASAQFGRNQQYTPEEDARDLKSVLFNWGWHMGMLRGVNEHELAVSLEYHGEGIVQVDGQPCVVSDYVVEPGALGEGGYRMSANYQYGGLRTQYSCTLPNGETISRIEVVHGQYAWNETVPGAEIMPGRGEATPMPDAVDDRLIRLWASPQGAVKAALHGAGIDLLAMDRNPGGLLEAGTSQIGDTSVEWEDDRPVVTYPIPGVPGAIAEATLDDRFMASRVIVEHEGSTIEFTYGNYDDWNNPLNKIEAYYAGTLTERRDGEVVRDIQTVQTETGSVYVVMPVPDSVVAAITPQQSGPEPLILASDRRVELTSTAPTPRTPDGKPDLTGSWGSGGMNWSYGNRRCAPTQLEGCSPAWNQTMDFEFEAPSRFGPNRPLYQPEHWDRVIELDMWTNREDPVMTCQPLGVPRQGPPRRIIQSENDIVFFYTQYADGGGGYGEYRIMPIDGREHNERELIQTKYMGHTVGHWEGDTLVLESIGFNDFTWLARGGFFHSTDMRVVEKLTRQGNQILYEVTVEDPEVLVEPWVMTPRILTLSDNPDAGLLPERGNCDTSYEANNIVNQIRH